MPMLVSEDGEVFLASDGLDSISTTEPSGRAITFREMIIQAWGKFFNKSTKELSTIENYDGSDLKSVTRTYTSSGVNETTNRAEDA